ncbi:MAG: polymerase subunit delta [Deltaproteobacteria bacterium]|nr:polymerase subunit delta [Deltaproteobacteria bacterium]
MAFEDIIGHDRQKRFLKFFLENKNIPHAFLLCGQEGIGKKKTAYEFVRHLFCQTGNACGICRPCLKLDRGSHPDLVAIENEGSIGIDDSRRISKEISEHPFESEKRVIIIDNAERMTIEAANALLKTIEEPPPHNHFFIITSSERDIPMTIRSRCSRVPFSLLSTMQLEHYFKNRKNIDQKKASLLSSISFGSIGGGLFWLNDEHFSLRLKLAEIISGRRKGFVASSSIAEMASHNDRNAAMYLAFLLSFFRDLFVRHETGDMSLIVNSDLIDELNETNYETGRVEESIKRIQESIRVMRYNVNRWLIFENLLIQIAGNRQ